ncbi:MAG: hypothetical protein ACTSU2_11585 [Promethearchaeota archaeon]
MINRYDRDDLVIYDNKFNFKTQGEDMDENAPEEIGRDDDKIYLWKMDNSNSKKEIGLAVSYYDQKLGPQFLGIAYNFSMFDNLTQYAVLQDSITSKSEELIIFVENKAGVRYKVYIKKFKIINKGARGGQNRYALLIFLPEEINELEINTDDIIDDFIEKIQSGIDIESVLKAWHILINDLQGFISTGIQRIQKLKI